jgi:butyrate kinase
MDLKILVVNPGSTSTKIAVYKNRNQMLLKNVRHDQEKLRSFQRIADQFDFRRQTIVAEVRDAGIELSELSIVVGRGGLLKPIPGGVYEVNDAMIWDLNHPVNDHESNLGGLIAHEIAREIGPGIKAIIVDPICVDEMEDIARISGMPELPRKSIFHALNQRAVARSYARETGRKYEEMNLIVAHMGGGVSVGAHHKGRVIDVNNGLNGDGPMTPERSGGLPAGQLVELCFSGKYTKQEIYKKIKGYGGFCAYVGTNDVIDIEQRILHGDEYARLVFDAMAYQVAKEIGALSTVFRGEVDGILLTGGVAYSTRMTEAITSRVRHLGPVRIYPGEGEMDALALNAYLVLTGDLEVKEYV